MMRNIKNYLIFCAYIYSGFSALADYENYSGENISGQDFSGYSHNNSIWVDAIAVGTIFSTQGRETSYENASFKSANLSNASFIRADLTGANLDGADFTGARLDYAILTDSIITNANFTESVKRGINWDVISTTKSFKDKDLSGIILDSNNLTGWDLSGQNLSNASFIRTDLTGANLDGANLTGVDFRGANFSDVKGNPTYKNTIMSDGVIQNFSMNSSTDSFSIRKYTPAMEGGETISAKIGESAAISGGAVLTLETGAYLELTGSADVIVADGASIIVNTDIDSSTNLKIMDSAKLAFEDSAIFKVNLYCDGVSYGQTVVFSALNWSAAEQALDIDNLVKGETFILSLNGEDFYGEWNYFIENNNLMISMQIPEPATYAAVFGSLVLALAACRRRL